MKWAPPQNSITSGRILWCAEKIKENFLFIIFVLLLYIEVAKELKIRYGNWTDDELFYEARERNIALYVKLFYEDYLPLLLGRHLIGGT